MIPYLRVYELSIINLIKYEILPLQYLERIIDDPLVADTVNGGYKIEGEGEPSPISQGRGLAVFDEATVAGKQVVDTATEQNTMITVNGASTYEIDYLRGRVVNPNTTPTSISYYWNYISVIESWPGSDPPPLPVVAVDVENKSGLGFQLGGGTTDVLHGAIYVFATSETEKRDITDLIHTNIENKCVPINNWHEGGYLRFDGLFNNSFTKTAIAGLGTGCFTQVVSNLNGPRLDWSEINRHRSRITFTFEVNRD